MATPAFRTFWKPVLLALLLAGTPGVLRADDYGKGNPATDPYWKRLLIFGGIDGGYDYLSTSAPDELNKHGYQFDVKGFLSYSWADVTVDGGLAWFYNRTTKDNPTGTVIRDRITTKAEFIRLAGRYRFTPRWELGLLNHILFGADTRFQTTEPLENNVNWLIGPEVIYRLPLRFPLQFSASFLTDTTIAQRQIYQFLFGVSIGFPLQRPRDQTPPPPPPMEPAAEEPPPVEVVVPPAAPAEEEITVRTYSFDMQLIQFDFGSAQLRPGSIPMLEEIGKFLAENSNNWTKLTIEGHTDNRGTAEYNLKLSRDRAESVRSVLIGQGIDPSSLLVEGYGFSRPRDEANTEAAWQKNRRVDFKLEGITEPVVMDTFFRKYKRY